MREEGDGVTLGTREQKVMQFGRVTCMRLWALEHSPALDMTI